MKRIVDMRSDTVTRPTPRMRQAMAEAQVGDDVMGEDPTINRLEAEAAAQMGKEAALFAASGTMGNLLAVLAHTQPGEEAILQAESHIYYYEAGGLARIAGVMPRLLTGSRGHLDPGQIREAVRPRDIHFPPATLLCLENTHNRAGGTVMPMAQLAEVSATGRELGLKIHMDGARIFNAAAALGLAPREIAGPVDSVMFCLSKGLGAPVGSLLTGTEEFIARARRMRKLLGGGMRQAGVLAAAGLVALEDPLPQLRRDHLLAKRLASGLAALPGIILQPEEVETNIIIFGLGSPLAAAADFVRRLKGAGVLANAVSAGAIRLVTHCDLTEEDGAWALEAVSSVVAGYGC